MGCADEPWKGTRNDQADCMNLELVEEQNQSTYYLIRYSGLEF